MTRIAIAGSTGYIGGRLAPLLIERNYAIRCLVRSPDKLRGRAWAGKPNVEICQADLADAAALGNHLKGCDVAFYLVHSMESAGADYVNRDNQLATAFAEAARSAGVKRILYLGGLGETGENLSAHLSSRREVESALASTGVPCTVFRAAMIIGSGSASFEILRYLVQRLPIMITPKWVSTRCQPIAVQNVLYYLVAALEVPETTGRIFDIGGRDVLTYNEIMCIMAEELKLPKRVIIPIPLLTPKLSSWWIHLITPLSHKIAQPLAEGLRNPVLCRETHIRDLIPQELLTVREAIQAAIKQISAREVETSWTMAGPIAGDPDWSGGTVFRDERRVTIDAPASAVFSAVCRVGGGHGWYWGDWLWRIRGWMDVMVGGPGLRRGRRDPERVTYGEALDFWRVAGIEQDRSLRLRAEMKLPGVAMLEFHIAPESGGRCVLAQKAIFQPRGLFGMLYWYSVLPFHHFVFNGMMAGIARQAETPKTATLSQ